MKASFQHYSAGVMGAPRDTHESYIQTNIFLYECDTVRHDGSPCATCSAAQGSDDAACQLCLLGKQTPQEAVQGTHQRCDEQLGPMGLAGQPAQGKLLLRTTSVNSRSVQTCQHAIVLLQLLPRRAPW